MKQCTLQDRLNYSDSCWKYAAIDKSGQACLFMNKPIIVEDEWVDQKSILTLLVWNVKCENKDWVDTLIERTKEN